MKGNWKLIATLTLMLTLLLSALAPSAATRVSADATFQLSGKVSDQSGNGVVGATVAALDPSSSTTVASTTTGSDGSYALSVAAGTYNIQVTPPSGSNFQTSTINNQTISADTTLNIVLVPAGAVTLSGRVLDPSGNGVPNQYVLLFPAGGGNTTSTVTDNSGHYSFQLAPGGYSLELESYGSANNAPGYYYLNGASFSVTQDTTLDLPLPEKKVTVHVQDAAGDPVANVGVSSSQPYNNNLTLGSLSVHGTSSSSATTDNAGDATLWLFPNTYTFSASPPAGSPFAAFSVPNVAITSDTSEVFALQFVHAPPVTTAHTAHRPTTRGSIAARLR